MKTWEIKLKAKDEKTAIIYLEMLLKSFQASVLLKEDMFLHSVGDPDKGEKLICRLK